MDVKQENTPQNPVKDAQKKGIPSGLFIALGLILGVAAGYGTGHPLLISIIGVLLGGIVEILNVTVVNHLKK